MAESYRRAGRDPGPAAVTYGDLDHARYVLSVPRFHARPGHEEFKYSNPDDAAYVGSLEADMMRTRMESDGKFE